MPVETTEIVENLKLAYEYKKPWIKEATEDNNFVLGKQWEDDDVDALKSAGVKALTINKCKTNIQLLSGIQRQNRSEFKSFPTGSEDQIKSDIATGLLKHVLDKSRGLYKISEQFEDSCKVGEGWLEPWKDFSRDMLTGELKIKKGNPFSIFVDPDSQEYDLSDAEYVIKFSPKLSKNKLYRLFPKYKTKIDNIKDRNVDIDGLKDADKNTDPVSRPIKYEPAGNYQVNADIKTDTYDLTEYYYKHYVNKYYVVNRKTDEITEAPNKKSAQDIIEQEKQGIRSNNMNARAQEYMQSMADNGVFDQMAMDTEIKNIEKVSMAEEVTGDLELLEIVKPEIWVACMIGQTEILYDSLCWTFPKWQGYPLFRELAYSNTLPTDKKELNIQGTIRNIKPLQIELNKRRTQELRHLNSSANSGWISEEDSWVDPDAVEKYGATPGVNLEFKTGKKQPQQIFPQPLSAGHDKLAAEASQDMKDVSGINTDLLAMGEGGQASGRAIALRQKQGLVMVQDLFDNLSQSQRIFGEFMLTQLGELFTVESAMRTLGESFIKENFSVPVMADAIDQSTGQPIQQPQVDPNTGQPATQVDIQAAQQVFSGVLNDLDANLYDIVVGESISSETVKYANYLLLMELVEKGVPIPMDVLIDESLLSSEQKEKVKRSIEQQKTMGGPVTGPGGS